MAAVTVLLEAGADPNVVTEAGTSLDVAKAAGWAEAQDMLQGRGGLTAGAIRAMELAAKGDLEDDDEEPTATVEEGEEEGGSEEGEEDVDSPY